MKIGGEDYHDLVIEYLNDEEAHEKFFQKVNLFLLYSISSIDI